MPKCTECGTSFRPEDLKIEDGQSVCPSCNKPQTSLQPITGGRGNAGNVDDFSVRIDRHGISADIHRPNMDVTLRASWDDLRAGVNQLNSLAEDSNG